MPSPVARPVQELIAEEQDYLFRGDPARLENPEWSKAACRDARPEAFFPISPRDLTSRSEALSHCARCTIRSACLTTALTDPTLVGIWGGTDEVDRSRLRGERRIFA